MVGWTDRQTDGRTVGRTVSCSVVSVCSLPCAISTPLSGIKKEITDAPPAGENTAVLLCMYRSASATWRIAEHSQAGRQTNKQAPGRVLKGMDGCRCLPGDMEAALKDKITVLTRSACAVPMLG
jgi:hypothetical protein